VVVEKFAESRRVAGMVAARVGKWFGVIDQDQWGKGG
jgi:hypothetical protein